MNNSSPHIGVILYIIGYGLLIWSAGWLVAFSIFLIQWSSSIDHSMKYLQKE